MIREEYRECMSGPVASVKTAFDRDGAIDYPATRNFVDFVIAGGASAVIIPTADSMSTVLTEEDIGGLTRAVVEQAAGRVPVASAAWWATAKSVEVAREARELGADLLLVFPPDWAWSCTPRTFAGYYAAVAEEIPLLLQTAPFGLRDIEIGMETFRILRDEVPGVVAIKEDIGGDFGRRVCLEFHEDWPIFCGGWKQNHMDLLPYGCDGYVSTYIDFAPRISQQYWQAIESGDLATAAGLVRDYDIPLRDFVSELPGGADAGLYGALELFGVCPRWRRPPYYSLNDEEMDKLAGFFQGLSLL